MRGKSTMKKKRPPRRIPGLKQPGPTHVKRFCGMEDCPGHYVPRFASVGDIVAFDEPADALGPAVHYVGEVISVTDVHHVGNYATSVSYEVRITSAIRGPLQPGETFWCENPRVVPTLCGVT